MFRNFSNFIPFYFRSSYPIHGIACKTAIHGQYCDVMKYFKKFLLGGRFCTSGAHPNPLWGAGIQAKIIALSCCKTSFPKNQLTLGCPPTGRTLRHACPTRDRLRGAPNLFSVSREGGGKAPRDLPYEPEKGVPRQRHLQMALPKGENFHAQSPIRALLRAALFAPSCSLTTQHVAGLLCYILCASRSGVWRRSCVGAWRALSEHRRHSDGHANVLHRQKCPARARRTRHRPSQRLYAAS